MTKEEEMLIWILRTAIIYVVVILAMRLMGKRQLGELQPSELVTTFLISNVASICINEPDLPLVSSMVPIFLIASLEVLNSSAVWYSPRYATLLFGRPVTVIRNGQICQSALRRLRITAADLMEALRSQGLLTPEEVSWGVIEPNGTLSIASAQEEESPMLPLLIDRQIYHENLEALSLTEKWVDEYLSEKGLHRNQVLLFLYDGDESLIIKKASRKAEGSSGRGKQS